MLEGAVARLLNHILGKYVVDLDTENLNVGIFSGQVQLTDLKLKTEALYELGLPIKVKAGTIGKIRAHIPWTTLWNQPVEIIIEDVHIIFSPIVTQHEPYDAEIDKILKRSYKKKILADLDTESHVIGGPQTFSDHLITNLMNNLHVTINNIHIRYEDNVVGPRPLAAGLCIGTITAETTNNKWKASNNDIDNQSECDYYLIKIDTLSSYWNCNAKSINQWDLPSQYYSWRNAMTNSLRNFALNNEKFHFVIKPMTTKIKITLGKSPNIDKCTSDVIVQDCNVQLYKDQYESLCRVCDNLQRSLLSWQFLSNRPLRSIRTDAKSWWKYSLKCIIEQRIAPYTWTRIKHTRRQCRAYIDTYKRIILNPNDTELKLDLQQYEDHLSIVNIVIARQHARLQVQSRSLSEKNFWTMLPSPERTVLCKNIGFHGDGDIRRIDYKYSIRIGNVTLSLIDENLTEIMIVTLTQTHFNYSPNMIEHSYKVAVKIEGVVVETTDCRQDVSTVLASQHLSNSPAYIFRAEFEKFSPNGCQQQTHRINLSLDSIECYFNRQFHQDLETFLGFWPISHITKYPRIVHTFVKRNLHDRWAITCDVKIPVLIVPEVRTAANVLVIDLGRYSITTELCQQNVDMATATLMELEERVYSILNIECVDMQVIFCRDSENWKDARKEKDTDLHVIPKISYNATYACCTAKSRIQSMPSHKLNTTFQSIKVNISERRIASLLTYLPGNEAMAKTKQPGVDPRFMNDKIEGHIKLEDLRQIERLVTITDSSVKTKRGKIERNISLRRNEKQSSNLLHKEDMNEAWARCVDLPGLEDNISPNNTISTLFRFGINEFTVVLSRSSDSTDRQYLMLRVGFVTMELAIMTYGPAYQMTINSILLTDKLHTTPSGQYLDLIYSPVPSTVPFDDVITILYRKVSAQCPDFWSHFHGVETSLVADIGTIDIMMHQQAINTAIKYTQYLTNKVATRIASIKVGDFVRFINRQIHQKSTPSPVPPGSVKFSHSARLRDLAIHVCDSDDDIITVQLSGLEIDFLFRANERFVFRSHLSNVSVDQSSGVTLYTKIVSTDEDKVFDVKYVRLAPSLNDDVTTMRPRDDHSNGGLFQLQLGKIHITFLYKLIVQIQRFVGNLEAYTYVAQTINSLSTSVLNITDTLLTSKKINVAINVCGPIFLLPQKSSSPNVMIIDSGDLHVENFFKDCSMGELVENILIAWTGITVTRGMLAFTSTLLENQETLIEPIALHFDVKRYSSKSWDIDGVLDTIRITLGQRDVSTIWSIYNDNIGEGKFADLLFPTVKLPISHNSGDNDDTVKTLEAFFSEPKQKNTTIKFSLEQITLSLFFDSGELLSSPIRDLNHGLCTFKLCDINTTLFVYNDGSLDGKISAETIVIEEIGPDANIIDKSILQTPLDDPHKSNSCNITINRAPIIDITFHQTTSHDKSVDIIIGSLSLSLSVPFCEKMALFTLDCLPMKDSNQDVGIVNHGYDANESICDDEDVDSTSLTISLRMNKPEFVFVIETTSNKKRFFRTHCEILSDYSRHSSRLNLVVSLSGLHSLFYDSIESNNEPAYTILKQCDVDLSICESAEKGKKIIVSISAIYVRICSRLVHSLNDVLNDIGEHFKLPNGNGEQAEPDRDVPLNLWQPRKCTDQIPMISEIKMVDKNRELHEILLVPKFEIVIILELEEIQVLLIKSTLEITIYDWSSHLNCTCEFTIQINYFNENLQTWEPFLDPVVIDELEFKPWDVLIKVFQDESVHMSESFETKIRNRTKTVKQSPRDDDDSTDDDMIYLRPSNPLLMHTRLVKTSLSTFLDDSDSENEDGTMEKLTAAISDLFTGDWNEDDSDDDGGESEDGGHSSDDDDSNPKQMSTWNGIFPKKSIYVLVDSKDILNISVTPTFLKVLKELLTTYSNKTLSVAMNNRNSINLINDIGPESKVELFEKKSASEDNLMCVKTYESQDSPPNTPKQRDDVVSDYLSSDFGQDCSVTNCGMYYDFETLSSLQFPPESTAQLYDKTNKNFLRIFLPNFVPIQTNCSKRNWQKLIRLHSTIPSQTYHLVAMHTIDKTGRNVTLCSPLQIKNETCYTLSVLYQPSVLQQLNLEPVGDVTNPFETTMRIAVLEAHECYNVPLYIAYHCKLFIQPAYADDHYVSESGIWWKDLATELDVAHNLLCTSKSHSNHEVFSLRVVLTKHLDIANRQTHSIPNYVINLLPPLILYNFLPYPLQIETTTMGSKQLIRIEPGGRKDFYSLDLSKDHKLTTTIQHDLITWSGILNFTTYLDEKIVQTTCEENSKHSLAVNVKCDREGSCHLYFYTPYWIVNKTGLPLQIKASASDTLFDCHSDDILLFTHKRHGKQTLNVKVYDSNWSNEFGLECAGTTGLIICRDHERKKKYLFFLRIKLSQMCPRLTKIVMLLPTFVIRNNTNRHLRFMEENEKTDLWIDLKSKESVNFWPETSSMQMYVKYKDTKSISQPFNIATTNRTVLRMDKGGALTVDVTGGVCNSFTVHLNDYRRGDAPILLKNLCTDVFLKIQQLHQNQVTLVSPGYCVLYTWDDPTQARSLIWNVYNDKGGGYRVDVSHDGYGDETISYQNVTPPIGDDDNRSSTDDSSVKMLIYWMCYRDDHDTGQKVLLFTQHRGMFDSIQTNVFHQHCDLECFMSFSGVGVSIFTGSTANNKEHMYLSIVDVPAIWEVNVGHKWKTLTLELATWIEDKYKLHYKKCQLRDYVHIDFEKMYMLKPFFAELKRTYTAAIYYQLRKSKNYHYHTVKLHTLQIDNKYNNSIVLHPSMPQQNIEELNSFVDVSILKDRHIYRKIDLKLGSFYLNIENDLILDLERNLARFKRFYRDKTASYVDDMKSIHDFKDDAVENRSIVECITLNTFEIQLHIANKVQLALYSDYRNTIFTFLDHILPRNISPYMPTEGVIHRISPIRLTHVTGKSCSVMNDLLSRVTLQFLQQYYSHVLGLQVLVNSFACSRPQIDDDLPHNDWEKMADLLLYGSRCLLSHINMSPAALEQCVVEIFANQTIENIQRIRRHGSYEKCHILPTIITSSCRNFHSGVPNALAQLIVKKPNAGESNCDGELFFRTTGKALLSLVTRHPDEKSDSVALAKEALRRAALLGEPIQIQQRLIRYFNRYLGLRPFSVYESMGQFLLETVGNSRFIRDVYWSHAAFDKAGKSIIIISLQHVIRINKCRLWGQWEVEWTIDLDDILSMPKITSSELIFNMRQSESNAEDLIRIAGDREILCWIHEKIEQAIIVSMEEKSWTATDITHSN